MRRHVPLAVLLSALTTVAPVSPAAGGDTRTVGFSVGCCGVVISQWLPPVRAAGDDSVGYFLDASCQFAGVLTPNNRLQVAFGGTAESAGPQIPQLTYIRCTISNQDAQSDYSEFANGGPISQTAKTTSPWRVSPIRVCVEGFAIFGPTPVTIITLAHSCSTVIA